MVYLVLTGNFLGFLPAHYAETFVTQDLIKPIAPNKLIKRTHIEMIVNRQSMSNPMVARFVEVVEGLPSWPRRSG